MPTLTDKIRKSHYRSKSARVFALFPVALVFLGAEILAEEQVLKIQLKADSVTVGATVVCSVEDFKIVLSRHAKDKPIHIENSPNIDSGRVLKLLEIVRNLGYERVTSTSVGKPGWTLYPLPNDRDTFSCEKDER